MPSSRTKKAAYVVYVGHRPGVYHSWNETQQQVHRYSGGSHKGFYSKKEAEIAWEEHVRSLQPLERAIAQPQHNGWSTRLGRARISPANNQLYGTRAGASLGASQNEDYGDPNRYGTVREKIEESRPLKDEVWEAVNIGDLPDFGPPVRSFQADGDYADCNGKASERICRPSVNMANHNDACESATAPSAMLAPKQSNGVSEAGTTSNSFTALETEPILSKEQQDLVDLVSTGVNVFYTGSAGTGKSTVLKAMVRRLKSRHVDIITPTGISALHVGGQTFFTYAGWTPHTSQLSLEHLRHNASEGKIANARLTQTRVLIIDEISMMENFQFERLNEIMQAARDSTEPFGGVQLIVTGDFCQLPPVVSLDLCGLFHSFTGTSLCCFQNWNRSKRTDQNLWKPFQHCVQCGKCLIHKPSERLPSKHYCMKCKATFHEEDKWAFCSRAWRQCGFHSVNLTVPHRQNDEGFLDILERCRLGEMFTEGDRQLLLNHPSVTVNAVRLFPLRRLVDRCNESEYAKLSPPDYKYCCVDTWHENEEDSAYRDYFFREHTEEGRSVIKALRDHQYEEIVRLRSGALVVLLHNLDQPAGLVNGSIGKVIGFKDIDAESLSGFKGRENDRMVEHFKTFMNKCPNLKWPIVRFNNGVTRLIKADAKDKSIGNKSWACRTQIPLVKAWAMTIHKSQGLTLSEVEVDLHKSFECGQEYVALSRAKSMKGLRVLQLSQAQIGGNKMVLKFLRETFGELKKETKKIETSTND